jgi:hypothetical protein
VRQDPHESDNDPPPEPGFARREAHKRKKRWKEQALRRLRPRLNGDRAVKEGACGENQGFTRIEKGRAARGAPREKRAVAA